MTKDYKKAPDSDTSSGNYGWMFSGIALGLIVGLGMYFYSNHQASLAQASSNTQAEQASEDSVDPVAMFGEDGNAVGGDGLQEPDPISVVIDSARAEQQDRNRATFSYYAVLPNLELDVAVKQSEKDKPIEERKPVVLKPGTHILQIASFKTKDQALRVQAELSKQSLATHIEQKKIKGRTWFRLFAGPSEQDADINTWKSVVEKAGFRPLIVKVQ